MYIDIQSHGKKTDLQTQPSGQAGRRYRPVYRDRGVDRQTAGIDRLAERKTSAININGGNKTRIDSTQTRIQAGQQVNI